MPKLKPGSTLTDKEKMFCTEYLMDMDATNAAIRAGYSEDSASTTGCHLKQKPEVEAYIEELLYERQLRLRITVDDVLLELAKIAFAEVADVLGDDTAEEAAKKKKPVTEEALKEGTPKKEISENEKKMMNYFSRQYIANKPSATRCTPASACRVVYKDQFNGRVTTIQFSLSAKISALKLLGRHLGLFGKTGKAPMPKPNIIFPRDIEVMANKIAA